MPKPPQLRFEPAAPPRDWFLAAIECDGSVAASLDAVLGELTGRAAFVAAIKRNLTLDGTLLGDAITDLGQRLKSLENTLGFRLGILRPERPAAWFRAPAATSTGPFASTVLDVPVFATYAPERVDEVKAGLEAAWAARQAKRLPFQDSTPCLWRTLVEYAEEWERIATLPAPHANLRLDRLPDDLPASLESRALRAFLLNVRNEMWGTRHRLDACYTQLLAASERLWAVQREEAAKRPSGARAETRERMRDAAEHVRAELRRRRAAQRTLLTPADLEALRFMGFHELPSVSTLRQRYLAMAKQLHPDRQGGDDGAFKILTGAYERLVSRVEGEI